MPEFSTDLQRCFFCVVGRGVVACCVVACCVVLAGCGEKFVVGDEDAATDGGPGNDARTDSDGDDACELATAEYMRACEFGERTYENICRGAAEGFVRYDGLCTAEVASLDACLEMKACGDFPCEEEATAWGTCLDEACSCREDCHPGCEPQALMFVLPPVALSELSPAFADGLCTAAANEASLGGAWVAYLGAESDELSERVPTATYHRTSDRQPAFSFSPGFPTRIQSFLFDASGDPVEPLMVDASGGLVSGEIVPAWSGSPNHCSSWTSSAATDQASLIELEGTLLNLGMFVVPCDMRDFEAHVLCLEVL